MSYILETFSSGETKRFSVQGRFFLLLSASTVVNVGFYRKRQRLNETVVNVSTGFSFESSEGFDEVEITSPGAQSIAIVISAGKVGFAASVNVTNLPANQGIFTQAAATVTNSSGQLVAANANRRYLLIQNKDASGDIYVTLTGADATTSNGIKIPAGGALELSNYCPTAAVYAIGSLANNANIVVAEG
jgi:hypothetical protein